MTTIVQVAQRGVITLPKALRKAYDVKVGDQFHVIDLGEGRFLLSKQPSRVDLLADQLKSELEGHGESLESMLRLLRDLREGHATA